MVLVSELIEQLQKLPGDLPVQLVVKNPQITFAANAGEVTVKQAEARSVKTMEVEGAGPDFEGPCVQLNGWASDCDVEALM